MSELIYDACFETLYDEFIDESETENFGTACTENLEIFLHAMARNFYEKGKSHGASVHS